MFVRRVALVVAMVFVAGCSAGDAAPRAARTPAPEPSLETPAPTPSPSPEPEGWRKDRYIPVSEAVARLRRHVDVPVVLPRDPLAGLRNYRGWLADPKYTDWTRHRGETTGTLKLTSRRDYLWISYGYAIPDGCGDRTTAIPVEVLGEPALLWAHGRGYSTIIWPVEPKGRIGRFGIHGTFEGNVILRLAESMETSLRRAPRHDPGC